MSTVTANEQLERMLAGKPFEIVMGRQVLMVDPFYKNPPSWAMLGFGGEHFVFSFEGRRFHTNSVWYVRQACADEPDTAVLLLRNGGYRGHCRTCQQFGFNEQEAA